MEKLREWMGKWKESSSPYYWQMEDESTNKNDLILDWYEKWNERD